MTMVHYSQPDIPYELQGQYAQAYNREKELQAQLKKREEEARERELAKKRAQEEKERKQAKEETSQVL